MVAESMQNAPFLKQVKENAPNDVFGIENKCEAHFSVLFSTKRNRVSRLSDEAQASPEIHVIGDFGNLLYLLAKHYVFPNKPKKLFCAKSEKYFITS